MRFFGDFFILGEDSMLLDKDFTTVDADLIFARVKGRPEMSLEINFDRLWILRIQLENWFNLKNLYLTLL